jgi:hypothetical protein
MEHSRFLLLPSGALTSKPFAFVARPWELITVPSTDTLDSFMGSVRLDLRGSEILRVLPLINEELNEEWVTDKARFSYDGLNRQRILSTYVCSSAISGELRFTSLINLEFQNRLKKLSTHLKYDFLRRTQKLCFPFSTSRSVAVAVGKETDLESAILLDGMLRANFRSVSYQLPDLYSVSEPPFLYRIDQQRFLSSHFFALIGINLRWESPLFNVKLLKKTRDNKAVAVYSCGVRPVSNVESVNIGSNVSKFLGLLVNGRAKFLRRGTRFNQNLYMLFHPFYVKLVHQLHQISADFCQNFPAFSILSPWASNQGYIELLGGTPYLHNTSFKTDMTLALNADSIPVSSTQTQLSVGYFTHGNTAHSNFDLLLPLPAYSEISCHYLNVFGCERYARFGTQILKESLPSWFSFLKEFLSLENNFSRRLVYALSSHFSYSNIISTPFEEDYKGIPPFRVFTLEKTKLSVHKNPEEVVPNYYRTHYVTRASKPMALASTRFNLIKSNFQNVVCY